MQKSLPNIHRSDAGFTLVELLVVLVVTALLMAGFTTFYLSEQRAIRHDEIEIETSQALRTALEQMSRDIRSAKKDLTYDYLKSTGGASPSFITTTNRATEFTLDADDSGTISGADPLEHKGFCLSSDGANCSTTATSGSLLELDAASGNYVALADNIDISGSPCSGVMFTYRDANGGNALSTGLTIKSVDICLTVKRSVIAGLPVARTESASVQLRNVR